MLGDKSADQFVSMLAHEFLVRPLSKVHYEVGRVEAQRLSHAKQIAILVDEPSLFLAGACLDNSCGSQYDVFALREE